MNFRFYPELVRTQLDVVDQKTAIQCVAFPLIEKGYVSSEYPELVMQREALYPTGLVTKGAMIAIPHSFDKATQGNHIAIGVLKHSVGFQNMEDMEQTLQVKLIFMLAISEACKQLEMLQVLMQMFKEEQLLKNMISMKSSEEICDLLNAYIATLSFTKKSI